MKKFNTAVLAVAFSSTMVLNGFAQTSPCSCISGPVAANAVVGNITGSSGNVLYSGVSGYAKAQPGAKLYSGSQISVGANSSANISVGAACKLNIPANSEVSILQPEGSVGKVCVRVANLADTIEEGTSTSADGQGSTLGKVVLAGSVVIAVGAALAAASR